MKQLTDIIKSYRSVLVAFSGGVDSAFVLKVARDVLGRDRAKAVTAVSGALPKRELEAARAFARAMDVDHRVIRTQELDNPNYKTNPAHRCYFCKTELYDHLLPLARAWGLETVCNGTNVDDLSDFRPGLSAADEHGVKSPLVEAGLTKDEIRQLAHELALPLWDKPASPCLASRIPHGEEITPQKLKQVETGENFLKDLGFRVVRLRHLGNKACLELGRDEFVRVLDVGLRIKITDYIRSLGFKTVVFERYQSGRFNPKKGVLNEAL